MPRREYTHGSSWAIWRWTDVVLEGRVYLRRLHLLAVRAIGSVMLHWIAFPDPQRDPHDHPVAFLSIVLRGGYTEWTPRGIRHVRWWNFKRATDVHRILGVKRRTLTLVFAGPVVRRWGFHTPEGWVDWRDYRGWK